jgi:hypothetical protein
MLDHLPASFRSPASPSSPSRSAGGSGGSERSKALSSMTQSTHHAGSCTQSIPTREFFGVRATLVLDGLS